MSDADDAVKPDAPPPETRDPEIVAMERCLAAGDHAEARRLAEALAKSDDITKAEAGRTMLARFAPDGVATAAFILTGGLIVMLAVHWLGHR